MGRLGCGKHVIYPDFEYTSAEDSLELRSKLMSARFKNLRIISHSMVHTIQTDSFMFDRKATHGNTEFLSRMLQWHASLSLSPVHAKFQSAPVGSRTEVTPGHKRGDPGRSELA